MSGSNRATVQLHAAPSNPPQRTLLVIGHKRSGTSIVARLLQLLGVHMGDDADPVMIEDLRLGEALRPRWMVGAAGRKLRTLIADKDSRFDTWGFKTPARNRAVLRRLHSFRHPHILYVQRDSAAVATRVSNGDEAIFTHALPRIAREQLALFRRVRRARAPTLVIAYEKLLSNPRLVILEIAAFCGLDADEAAIDNCVSAVRPNDNAYTETWRQMPPGKGYVDRVSATSIGGWAVLDYEGAPVEVTLLADDMPLATTLAQQTRPDVRERRMHHSGKCGFSFDLRALAAAIPATALRLSVRIAASGFELNGSPLSIANLDLPDQGHTG